MADFKYFPLMDEYLRRMVWRFYYEAPRIHVIHAADALTRDPDIVELTCSSFDATYNTPVKTYFHYDINRESRAVALHLRDKNRRDRLWDMLRPFVTASVFHQAWPVEPTEGMVLEGEDGEETAWRKRPQAPPVDVDWANDLIYICSPTSGLPFASFRRSHSDWSGKIQRLALAQPFETTSSAMNRPLPTSPRGDRHLTTFRFNAHMLDETLAVFSQLREFLVVSLPDPPQQGQPTDMDKEREEHDVDDDTQGDDMTRDDWGFVSFSDYLRQKNGVENRRFARNTTDTTRNFLALKERLPAERGIRLAKCVDVDGKQRSDGSYRRLARGGLPKPPTNPVVNGTEFSFVVSGP